MPNDTSADRAARTGPATAVQGTTLTVASETPTGAPQRVASTADDDVHSEGLYRSDEVVLPTTVPELIRAYEVSYKTCQSLKRLCEQIGTTGVVSTPQASNTVHTATAATARAVALNNQDAVTTTGAPSTGVVKGRVVGKDAVGPPSPPRSSEALQRLIREAMESLDQKAASEVVWLTSRVRALEKENEARVDPTTSTDATSAAEDSERTPPAPDSRENEARRCREDQLRYERAQLRTRLNDYQKKCALLQEAKQQLEGQVQRLLMSSAALMDGAPTVNQRPVQAPPATSTPSKDAPPVKEPGGTNDGATPAARTKPASSSTQITELEKQIDHLRSTVDKLQADAHTSEQRRTKLEAALRKSRQEHAAARESLLQFRRQVNESEIAAETDASEKDSEARALALEKECIRLRTAFAERRERYATDLEDERCARRALGREVAVYQHAMPRLLRQLAALQIRDVIHAQRTPALVGGELPSMTPPDAGARNTDCGAQIHLEASQPEQGTSREATEALASGRQDETVLESRLVGSPTSTDPRTPVLPEHETAMPTRTLSDDQRNLLHDIKTTYERRLESMEAHMRAETKHLHSLNKELRTALAASQEEARASARQLARLRSGGAAQGDRVVPAAASFLAVDSALQMSSADNSSVLFSRTNSPDASPLSGTRVLERGTGAPRSLSVAEMRYDPENMSTWEAVQIENEALLARLSAMQEEKWRLSSHIEDLQSRCAALEESHQRQNSSRAEQLVNTVLAQGFGGQRNAEDARLRSLQALLQETLQENIVLQEEVNKFKARFGGPAP